MKKRFLLITIVTAAAVILTACGHKQAPPRDDAALSISLQKTIPGDSTRYGLACDGCTDSILLFLPYTGGDPDTFDIIEAQKHHRIYGRPHIGDELAIVVNPEKTDEALMVININMLQGQWCYKVTPTLRASLSGQARPPLPDSIRRRIMAPREYGIRLKRDYTAFSIGNLRPGNADAMSPVSYPDAKHYTSWRIHNGRIILKADTIPGLSQEMVPESDTATIVLLRRDSLVLRFADHEQSYYRKKN